MPLLQCLVRLAVTLICSMRWQHLPLGEIYNNGVIKLLVTVPTAEDLKLSKRPANRTPAAKWTLSLCGTGLVLLWMWCDAVGAC